MTDRMGANVRSCNDEPPPVPVPRLCSCRLKINHLRGWRLVGTNLCCTVCDGMMRPDQTGERHTPGSVPLATVVGQELVPRTTSGVSTA